MFVSVMVGVRPSRAVVLVVVVKALTTVIVNGELSLRWRNIAREYSLCGETQSLNLHSRLRLSDYKINYKSNK